MSIKSGHVPQWLDSAKVPSYTVGLCRDYAIAAASRLGCFGFQVGIAPDNQLLINARCMIVKFLCQRPYS